MATCHNTQHVFKTCIPGNIHKKSGKVMRISMNNLCVIDPVKILVFRSTAILKGYSLILVQGWVRTSKQRFHVL